MSTRSPTPQPETPRPEAGIKRSLLLPFALAALLATFLLYGESLRYAFLGYDTYPIIVTSRVQSPGDVADSFTRELMDGRYPLGHFYRPVLNLSIAVDYAVWKLNAWGYHLTDLLLLAVCGVLLPFVARAAGSSSRVAGALTTLFFLVHPVQMNIVPVPARRGDTLALLFTVLALVSSGAVGRKRLWLPALFTLLALGSKESGALAPFLLFVLCFVAPRPEGTGRLRSALLASLPAFGSLLLFVAVRQAVLGGLGGHADFTLGRLWSYALLILPRFEAMTLTPFPLLDSVVAPSVMRRALLVGLAVASVVFLRGPRARGPAILAWAWLLLGWAIHGLSQVVKPWYAIHTVAPLALLFGLLVRETIGAVVGAGGRTIRVAGAFAGIVLVLLFAVNLVNAPLFVAYPEWLEASEGTERYLAGIEEKLEATPDGETIVVPVPPSVTATRRGSPVTPAGSVSDYSVQAWAELEFPERRIRVSWPRPEPPPPAAGEVLVVIGAK